jgi:hypothetical protein
MKAKLPGANTTGKSRPTLIANDGVQLGVSLNTVSALTVTPKATIEDPFDDLDDFVTIYGEPTISSGKLAGDGIVRHKTQALTDNHKVTAKVGSVNFGTTRLYCCADESLSSYYAVEVNSNLLLGDKVNFIKGVPGSSVESAPGLLGILNSILALLFGLLSIFSRNVTPAATKTSTSFATNDEVSIWYDEPNTTVRIYKNSTELLAVPVPRGEIPHGPGYRWHGAAVGIEVDLLNLGALFSSYKCQDQ